MLKDTCIKYKMLLPAVVSINKYKKSIVWQQMVFLPTVANRSVGRPPRGGSTIIKNANPEPDTKIACFYGVNRINEILAQPDCIGIRTYYAIDDKGAQQLVLVGVNPEGNNIWDLTSTLPNDGGLIMDKSGLCPPYCPNN